MNTALVKQENGLAPQDFFSPEQRKMIRDTFLGGASDHEAAVLMEVARARRLNPITRQIHFLKRNQWDDDAKSYVTKWSCQVSIDGLRAVAERTGRYDGQDEPEFKYEAKKLIEAKVKVWKTGIGRPFVGIAHFSEYAQFKKDGQPTKMWAEKPHIMLAKCAEALALRKAFPDDTSGLYTEDEMPHQEPAKAPAPAVSHKVDDEGTVFDGATGEVVKPAVDDTLTEKLQTSVNAGPPTATGLLAICNAGFDNEFHWKNWGKKYASVIKALPPEEQAAIRAAYANAVPKAHSGAA